MGLGNITSSAVASERGVAVRYLVWIIMCAGGCQTSPTQSTSGEVVRTLDSGMDEMDAVPRPDFGLASAPGPIEPLLLSVTANDGEAYIAGGRRGQSGGVLLRAAEGRLSVVNVPMGPMLWWVWRDIHGRKRVCGEGARILTEDAQGDWTSEILHPDERVTFWGGWTGRMRGTWVVGGSHDRFGPKAIIFRQNRGAWRQVDTSMFELKTNLYKVWGAPNGPVFMVGEGGVGLVWSESGLRRADMPTKDLYFTVHGNRNGLVLAVGGTSQARVARWENSRWVPDNVPEGWPPLSGVFVGEDGRAVAVGHRGTVVERSAHGHWSRVVLAEGRQLSSSTLHAVYANQNIWVVGGDFTRQSFGTLLTDYVPSPLGEITALSPDEQQDDMIRTTDGGRAFAGGAEGESNRHPEDFDMGLQHSMDGGGAGRTDEEEFEDAMVPSVASDSERDAGQQSMNGGARAAPDVVMVGGGSGEAAAVICGDGVLSAGEACDDGNRMAGDGCDSACQFECGNLRLDEGENCDDGNREAGDGCDSTCRRETRCGDGILSEPEECDDGNRQSNDGCNEACLVECGNRQVEGREECDDGNRQNGDGCSSRCRLEPPGAGDWCERPCLAQYECLGLGGPEEPAICTKRCDTPLDCAQAGFQGEVCCERIGFQLPDTYCIPEAKLADGCAPLY